MGQISGNIYIYITQAENREGKNLRIAEKS